MIFTAYFDEADTHGPAPTVIMAGYIGHAYQWRRFEQKLARLQARDGFRIFHAKDFKARVGEFSGWSDDKCDRLIADLMTLVRDLAQGFTVALSRDRYLNEYRAPPIPRKMTLDSQYGACFRVCLAQLLKLMEARRNRDRVSVVIEGGHRNVGDCLRIFNEIKSRWRQLGIDVLGSITIENKNDCLPLMVADLLAAAHSMLRTGVERETIRPEDFILPVVHGQSATNGQIAILDLAPSALKDLKVGFELERQKAVELWRARKITKMDSAVSSRRQSY